MKLDKLAYGILFVLWTILSCSILFTAIIAPFYEEFRTFAEQFNLILFFIVYLLFFIIIGRLFSIIQLKLFYLSLPDNNIF